MPGPPLRVVPLGGLGEIGRNMMALEYGDDLVVVDAGVLFPGQDMPGVDLVIPDMSYVVERRSRVKAVLVTHGHEDHIGALPYLLSEVDAPVYASRLTHGLITVKLREHGLLKDARLNVVEPGAPFRVGSFRAEFFRVCHSIPDAMGIALTTPAGTVVHTGDFKIDHTPADGKGTDFSTISRLASEGVLLLLSDSTYAEVEGYTPSEQVVGDALDHAIGEAEGRVMVATFASLISRMQQVIDAAVKHGRKVTVVGRSMSNNFKMAVNMGYINAPEGTAVSMNEARQLPHEEVLILATGAQGEPTSALVRIANGEHQDVEVVPGDTVVISASPIPGNETVVAKTIDNLFRQGARVLYNRIATVHVHGHGSREELKMMLSLVRPRYFVPVHGEYRHLVAHAELAMASGVPEENAFVLEDGDVLELTPEFGEVVDRVPAGPVMVDGHRLWGSGGSLLEDRRRLAHDGVVFVTAYIDGRSGAPLAPPEVMSSGLVNQEESAELHEKASQKAQTALESNVTDVLDLGHLEGRLADAVSEFVYAETRTRPTVLAHVEAV